VQVDQRMVLAVVLSERHRTAVVCQRNVRVRVHRSSLDRHSRWARNSGMAAHRASALQPVAGGMCGRGPGVRRTYNAARANAAEASLRCLGRRETGIYDIPGAS
jgi:hypothetical protein